MKRFQDLIIGTQFSTSCAWMCALAAHLVDRFANDNWQFSVYLFLVFTVVFMLAPHTMFLNEENEEADNPFKNIYIDENGWMHDRDQWIKDNCDEQS